MDERVLDVTFSQPVQVTRCAGGNAFDSHKAAICKMIDQEFRDIGALPA
jgi:hypothetical protein